jgi:hypothetical protein
MATLLPPDANVTFAAYVMAQSDLSEKQKKVCNTLFTTLRRSLTVWLQSVANTKQLSIASIMAPTSKLSKALQMHRMHKDAKKMIVVHMLIGCVRVAQTTQDNYCSLNLNTTAVLKLVQEAWYFNTLGWLTSMLEPTKQTR